jgi:hypothetical protein
MHIRHLFINILLHAAVYSKATDNGTVHWGSIFGRWRKFHFHNHTRTCSGVLQSSYPVGRVRLKWDGTRAETRFRLSARRTSPFKSAGASVQSTTGSRGVRISGSNAVYTMFRGGVKGTGYPLHLPVSPSLPLPRVTVCHQISTGLYDVLFSRRQGERLLKLTMYFLI